MAESSHLGKKFKYTDIIVEKKHPIGYITINRPEKRNTITNFPGGTKDQLLQAFLEMKDDPEIKVFLLKGTGNCFTAGWDMSFHPETSGREKRQWKRELEQAYRTSLGRQSPILA